MSFYCSNAKASAWLSNVPIALIINPVSYTHLSESLASFTTGELYDHHDAEGFINLFGLPLKVRAMKMQEQKL